MPTAVPVTVTPQGASSGAPPRAMATRAPAEPMRQIVVLALAAFVIGFVGFMALGRPLAIAATSAADPQPAAVVIQPADESLAASPASDDWNLPKRI